MTQKELGIKLGFDEKNADIRISQYESDYGVPKDDMVRKMSEILNVNYNALKDYNFDNPTDILESFLGFDTEFPLELGLFEFKPNKDLDGKAIIEYPATDNQFNPIAITFALNEYRQPIKEWKDKKRAYTSGEISKEDYIEWKLQWHI